jgi:Fe-S-cluster-containing dehydrogenase component
VLAVSLPPSTGGKIVGRKPPLERAINKGRRRFCKLLFTAGTSLLFIPFPSIGADTKRRNDSWYGTTYKPEDHLYGMGISVDRCIGCGRCVDACKKENNVPDEPFYFRTWIERDVISEDGEVTVDSPNGGRDSFRDHTQQKPALKTFFVPKICNQCHKPPCVQACPVGATYITKDGVILVDNTWCIGCRYCIQACPYGMRYIHPTTRTADKCTFCYHRITRGLAPACVETCPTRARIFGDLKKIASPLTQFRRRNKIMVLKPQLNTEPKVYYAGLDQEVK